MQWEEYNERDHSFDNRSAYEYPSPPAQMAIPVDAPGPEVASPVGAWPRHLTGNRILLSKSSIVTYGVLLAGLLGSFLGQLLSRSRDSSIRAKDIDTLSDLAAHLLVGASVAFVAAILLPLALTGFRYPSITIGQALNPWALFVLAGLVAYSSRRLLADLTAAMSRILAEAANPLSDDVREQIVDSIKTGMLAAITPRPLANYNGFISVNIFTAETGKIDQALPSPSLLSAGVAWLEPGRLYRLDVSFATTPPAQEPLPSGRLVWPFKVEGGIDESNITFDVHIDFGYVSIPLAQRKIDVPRLGSSETSAFEFSIPVMLGIGDSVAATLSPISVAVYQRGTFCDIVQIQYASSTAAPVPMRP